MRARLLLLALGVRESLVRRHEVAVTPQANAEVGAAPARWCSAAAVRGCERFAGGAVPPAALADRLLAPLASVEDLYALLGLRSPSCAELCEALVEMSGPTLAPPGVSCGDPACAEQASLRRSELVPSDAVPLDDEEDGDDDEVEGPGPAPALDADGELDEDELWEHALSLFGIAQLEEGPAPEAEAGADGVSVVRRARRSSRGSAISFGPKIDPAHEPKLKVQREQAAQSLEVAIDALGAKRPSETTLEIAQQYLGESTPEVLRRTVQLLKVARRAVGKQRYETCKPTTGRSTKAYVIVWRSGKKGDRHRKFLRSEKDMRSGHYITHLCPAHWAPNRDVVTRAGTIVHEATHHAGAGDKRSPSTGRKVYAYRSVLRLAQEDVFLAQNNAQSLRYLVWDLARHE